PHGTCHAQDAGRCRGPTHRGARDVSSIQGGSPSGGRAPTGRNGPPMSWRGDGRWCEQTVEEAEQLRQARAELATRSPSPRPSPARGGRLTVAEAERRQARVRRDIEYDEIKAEVEAKDFARMKATLHAKRNAQLARERDAEARRHATAVRQYAEASADAIAWMARYISGWAGSAHP